MEPARLAGAAVLRTQSDDRLVDLVRDGNDSAFEAIVHRYRRQLLRYCGRMLAPARAEDAVQQAFVNAYGALRDSGADINLRPWLYRIAHNSALNVLRAAGADHVPVDEQIDGVETPPQAVERGERLRAVVAAVQQLPDRQRDAIVLQALEGRSYDEIAVELGVSGGAVRQLLNRARTTLREGVTALTPPALVARAGAALDAPVADRVAQVVAGAGGSAVLAKGVALIAMAGAVAGGAAEGVLPGSGGRPHGHPTAAAAAGGASGVTALGGADAESVADRRGGHGSEHGRGSAQQRGARTSTSEPTHRHSASSGRHAHALDDSRRSDDGSRSHHDGRGGGSGGDGGGSSGSGGGSD